MFQSHSCYKQIHNNNTKLLLIQLSNSYNKLSYNNNVIPQLVLLFGWQFAGYILNIICSLYNKPQIRFNSNTNTMKYQVLYKIGRQIPI